MMKFVLLLCVLLACSAEYTSAGKVTGDGDTKRSNADKPNIIFILADDMGYHDIGYNNDAVLTPNLDKLAKTGRIMNQNYVIMVCSPSRGAIMIGIYPYRMTLQHLVINGQWCAPTNLVFLPERLQAQGYETAALGKWHLGFCQEECMPMSRGFDHQYGLMHGAGSYFEHVNAGSYDWRDDDVTDWSAVGNYTTDLLGTRAVEIIQNKDKAIPLFMYLAFTAPHTPLEVPPSFSALYAGVSEPRKTYLGMISSMDEVVGNIVKTLKQNGEWDNTLIVFSSDNGGDSGFHADNFPLRGAKGSLWEGGSRALGFVGGPVLTNAGGQIHNGTFHAVDWVPTLVSIAGGSTEDPTLDGVNQKEMIMHGGESARTGFVYNIDLDQYAALGNAAIRDGDLKLIWGFTGMNDGWGVGKTVSTWLIPEYCELAGIVCPPPPPPGQHFSQAELTAQMAIIAAMSFTDINSGVHHLFNLAADPYEENDLADDPAYEDDVLRLKQRLLDLIDAGYRPPPPIDPFNAWGPAMPALEPNPTDPNGIKAWGLNWCVNTDITVDVNTP